MEFGVLGPLLVSDAGGPVLLASAKQRALLASLLLETPTAVVPTQRLIDDLWGDDPPATAGKALQVHVSQLRRALGPRQPIVTRATGYAIQIERGALDLHRFDALLAGARHRRAEGDLAAALVALREADTLWRGPALVDVMLLGPGATAGDRLESTRMMAQEECLELELALGGHSALVPALEALVAHHPYRERPHGLLMLALYRAGRQADALEAFRRARALLVGDLGLEPGPELVRLEAAILAQDPALDLAPSIAAPPAPQPAPAPVALPRESASILGREAELRAAFALIERPDVGLLTLTGPGGIGKTRLAMELAARLGQRSRVVELATIMDPDRVIPAICAAVGAAYPSEASVAVVLRREALVLFLDNFEQVLAAAPAVASLVRAVSSLTVVVTSRSPLHIAGEHELQVPPLTREAAVELFVSRAREQNPGFSPDAHALGCIAAVCARVDGLPLAIELASARMRVLTPDEILDRVGRRLDLLTAGRRDAPERHRTLRATIGWSHDLLDAKEQRLFQRLSVFQSGWSLAAAEAVSDGRLLDPLTALVTHSLVIRDGSRFRMLETVREYATERLEASGDATAARRRLAIWCLGLAVAAEQELEGPEQATWFARLDADHANLRAAATWATANGEGEIALGLDGALWRYWLARGAAAEVWGRLTVALETGLGDATLRAKAFNAAGVLAGATGDVAAAQAAFDVALDLAAELGDPRQTARILMNLGVTAVYCGDYVTALARYGDAGAIWQKLGDLRGQSVMHANSAVVHGLMGHFEQALPLLEQSVELARAAGDRLQVACTLIELGKQLVQHRPQDPQVPALLHEGMNLSAALDERRLVVECLEVLAALSGRQGDPATGAGFIGAADAERARAGMQHTPDQRPFFDRTTNELTQALGREAYEREREQGRRARLPAAVAAALKSVERAPGLV